MELYRTQTADQVLEVYRRRLGIGVPKEMLTDRGRQYTNWRETTRFERELGERAGEAHQYRSSSSDDAGEIERFWKTIYEEFLVRAQFGKFRGGEESGSGKWVQYYNHKRPHQGIGGLCPADRYFRFRPS